MTGASDRVTRVFSRCKERQAPEEVIQEFESSVKGSSIPQQQMGQINKEKLPGPEFLQRKSGTKEGQVQMIREDDGSITAHTWSAAARQWVAVGTVVDSAGSSGRKTEYMGQDYDYVFDVDIEDGKPPLKLPYNLSQNPYQAATKFIETHQLPIGYLDQVANFITTNTRGASLDTTKQSQQSREASSSQPAQQLPTSRTAVLPQTSFLSIKTANMKAIPKKIAELNSQLVSGGSKELSLSPSEIENIGALCGQLESSTTLEESRLLETSIPLVVKIATVWPTANRLPGLDLLRLLAAVSPLTATSDPDGGNVISTVLSSGVFDPPLNVNNAMLATRMLANLFETEAGRDLVAANFDDVVRRVQATVSNAGRTGNRNLTIAVTTLYINYAVYITSRDRSGSAESSERALVLLEHLTKLVTEEKDSEAVYRGLVALGTLVKSLGEEVKTAAKQVYDLDKTLSKVLDAAIGREPRIKGVVDEIKSAT